MWSEGIKWPLGSRTCRVMYFYLPRIRDPLFIRGPMREPTNQNRQRETSLVAEDVKSEEWPEEETFVRVNQPTEGGWYVLPEQWIPCRWRREGGGGVRGIPV